MHDVVTHDAAVCLAQSKNGMRITSSALPQHSLCLTRGRAADRCATCKAADVHAMLAQTHYGACKTPEQHSLRKRCSSYAAGSVRSKAQPAAARPGRFVWRALALLSMDSTGQCHQHTMMSWCD